MKSDWHQDFIDYGGPVFLAPGIWDCRGETVAQAHVRMHRTGIKISDVYGYKNVYISGGPSE